MSLQLIKQLLLFLVISFSLWTVGIRCCEAVRQDACRVVGYPDQNHRKFTPFLLVSIYTSLTHKSGGGEQCLSLGIT